MSSQKKLRVILTCGFTFLLIGFSIWYGTYYQHRALPGIVIGGEHVGGMKAGDVKQLLAEKQQLSLKLSGEVEDVASMQDLGITVEQDKAVDIVFNRNKSFLQYLEAPFTTKNISVPTSVDHTVLYKYLNTLTEDKKGTEGAKFPEIVQSKDKSKLVVQPGKPGIGLDPSVVEGAALNLLNESLSKASDNSIKMGFTQFTPLVTEKFLDTLLPKANALYHSSVTIKGEDKTFTPTKDQIFSWINFPSPEMVDLKEPVLSDEKVTQWVQDKADSLYVEPVTGKRNVDPSGKVTQIRTQKVDGHKVTNVEDVKSALITALHDEQPYSGEFHVETEPASWEEKHVVADAEKFAYQPSADEKWIDINLANLTTTAYIGDKVAIGPVSIVPGAPLTPTVTGTFDVYAKYTSQTMRGFNVDGSRYETPGVPWILYFHQGYALHGAPWRGAFGTMANGGSHGCVNMPVGKAKAFFDWAPVGTPVVVHK